MKLKLAFTIIMFTIKLGYAQINIFPLSLDTPKWCMVSTNYNGGDPLFFYSPSNYYYEKDTLIEGKIYSKLMQAYITPNFTALIRNIDKKTFIRRVTSLNPIVLAEEMLLYDFNLDLQNDSLRVSAFHPSTPNSNLFTIVKFVSADSILINGNKRKRTQVNYLDSNRPSRVLDRSNWVEGYGDFRNPFLDCLYCSDGRIRTMGLDIKGQRIYQDSTIANGCTPKRVSVYDPLFANVSIYPNPVMSQLAIDLNKTIELKFSEIIIQNLVGKIVYKQPIDDWNTPLSIDVSNFNAGMYIVSLQVQNKKIFSKKIIKSN